jgi:flagellar hook assembly protein FlgD
VVKAGEIEIINLINFPNPFTNLTYFRFDHNQACCDDLEVEIYIYNLQGQIVQHLETTITPEGFESVPMSWDGRNEKGLRLVPGVYVYRVNLTNKYGASGSMSSKLVVIN